MKNDLAHLHFFHLYNNKDNKIKPLAKHNMLLLNNGMSQETEEELRDFKTSYVAIKPVIKVRP